MGGCFPSEATALRLLHAPIPQFLGWEAHMACIHCIYCTYMQYFMDVYVTGQNVCNRRVYEMKYFPVLSQSGRLHTEPGTICEHTKMNERRQIWVPSRRSNN